jgi:aldehyde dehydrogenase (NAD+)
MKSHFIGYLKEEITKAYGENPRESLDFARIVNTKNWQRLVNMIEPDKVIFGGQSDVKNFYIAPTLMEEPLPESQVMKDEIFGPILPIIAYENETDIETIISRYEKPLALYIFTENRIFSKQMIQKYSFGGGCVNDTMVHFSNKRLPFGGVGHSGIGAYHGGLSFDTFSHKKSILKKSNLLDLPMRYAPYKDKLATIKTVLKWL